MEQSFFCQWRPYLFQMYRKAPKTTTGEKYKVLDFHWANFGWGKDPEGRPVHHPDEVWLYKCKGDTMEEWYKETPVKLVFSRNVKPNGTLPGRRMSILEWIKSKGRDFDGLDEPIPLELAKQWDLHKLSIYLIQWLTQDAIDMLYPEPEEADPDAVLEDEGEESDAEE